MRLTLLTLVFVILCSLRADAQRAPNATLEPTDLAEFSSQPYRIKELIVFALALTKLDLDYTFGSDDPARGGMDCSGTIYHLLHTQGLKDVPRDSASQYQWTRTAGGYHDVASKSAESDEFAGLRPGDLMFWSGTYETGRPGGGVSHVMLYLGTEKKTHKRVMFGASDGRSYNGIQRFGVSVFDFKMPRPEQKADFLGYGHIPGLPTGTVAATATTVAALTPPVPEEEDEAPKSKSGKKSGPAKPKAKTPDPELGTSKPGPKTPAPKSEAGKQKSEPEESQPKPQRLASKSQGAKSATEQSKAESAAPQSDESEPAPKSPASKSKTRKSKTESSESPPQNEAKPKTEKTESEAPKLKAGFQKPKVEPDEPPSGDAAPKAKTKSLKPKAETGEPDSKVQKSKPPTSTPKPRPKSKTSEAKADE